jgi:hypothetical protein
MGCHGHPRAVTAIRIDGGASDCSWFASGTDLCIAGQLGLYRFSLQAHHPDSQPPALREHRAGTDDLRVNGTPNLDPLAAPPSARPGSVLTCRRHFEPIRQVGVPLHRPSFPVSFRARTYLIYLGLRGYATFDYPWLFGPRAARDRRAGRRHRPGHWAARARRPWPWASTRTPHARRCTGRSAGSGLDVGEQQDGHKRRGAHPLPPDLCVRSSSSWMSSSGEGQARNRW